MSNGDVGYDGRRERKRCNATGTTHGGIEQIGGKWYVFYHRLTHGSDYSRQMCAEPLELLPDGSIAQAEMTSCGLNGGDLPGMGEYPAVICCNLTNGKCRISPTKSAGTFLPLPTPIRNGMLEMRQGERRSGTSISPFRAIPYCA